MIFEKIKGLIVEELKIPAEKISPESRISEDLGADSMDAVELIMKVEEEFNIQISDEAAQGIRTVGDLVKVIESLQ